jgi:protein N-terminal glutamine amidohydrolase
MRWKSLTRESVPYTSHFCEENICQLARQLLQQQQQEGKDEDHDGPAPTLFCVFISNNTKQTPIWKQRLGSPEDDGLVVWDYHVILVLRAGNNDNDDLVFDADSTLPFPCPLVTYVEETFKPHVTMKPQFRQ